MKFDKYLKNDWKLKQIEPACNINPAEFLEDGIGWLPISNMPAQVQDVLYDLGMLSKELRLGWCLESLWIEEYDWVYRCCFHMDKVKYARLILEGLDTFADVYLNGNLIGRHDDFYLPDSWDVTGVLGESNVLLIHFHRISDYLERITSDPVWGGTVNKCKNIRKPIHDFPPEKPGFGSNYQGAVPYFTPIGVYGDIYVQTYEKAEMTDNHILVSLDDLDDGMIQVSLSGTGEGEGLSLEYALWKEQRLEAKGTLELSCQSGKWTAAEIISIKTPALWQPIGFGSQSLYQFSITLSQHGIIKDYLQKTIGFRKVKMLSPFEFFINGNRVRLWGGSLDPLQGYTHCYSKKRANRLFDMVENAHINLLRIWGEGIPLPDQFYEEADKRGILIWQEFFLGHGPYPDTEYIRSACKKEAEVLVKRLCHRPSILMWCGGNETLMGAEFMEAVPYGADIFLKEFPKIIERLDPERYYHPNSPYGGEWSNDPREGDYHTYDCVWEYPYLDYPNFISEHIRTSPPVLHSLKRMIKGDVWEEGDLSRQTYEDLYIMPENWVERSHLNANGQRKTGPYWEFYDSLDVEGEIYRFGAAYGQEIRRYGEQVRRGSRNPDDGAHRSKGYLACKLLDTWPKIYCASIDFFQEGYIPYYSLLHLFQPVLLSFEKADSIRLWLVNDSPADVKGSVTVALYHLERKMFVKQDQFSVCVSQGDAARIFDLAAYGFFSKDCILYAKMEDEKGRLICSSIDFVEIERHLKFAQAKLQVRIQGEELIIAADEFVRCVEIRGVCGEDEFGWLFDDNYFDMMPGEVKTIKILGDKEDGTIFVKGHYLKVQEEVLFVRKKRGGTVHGAMV